MTFTPNTEMIFSYFDQANDVIVDGKFYSIEPQTANRLLPQIVQEAVRKMLLMEDREQQASRATVAALLQSTDKLGVALYNRYNEKKGTGWKI